MCEVFIRADPSSYESRTRSVRLHGVVTSIRLENLHWEVLEEIGARDGMSVTHLLERLYDELVEARGEVGNFASFLRVSALLNGPPSRLRSCPQGAPHQGPGKAGSPVRGLMGLRSLS